MTERRRALRRNDLDRSELYVIGFNGRAWEAVGIVRDPAAVEPYSQGESRTPGGTAGHPGGRHARRGTQEDERRTRASVEESVSR